MNKEKLLLSFPIMIGCKMKIKWNSKISGIYAWINEINGKVYIGRSVNLYKRVYDEMNGFQNGKEQNMKKLFNAIKKHGIENFRVVKLEECSKENLNTLEKFYIEHYDSKNNGYNCTFGGEGTHGHIVSNEQKQKQRESLRKYWSNDKKLEHSEKMRMWANDRSRKNHLIEIGKNWRNDPLLVAKQKEKYNKSLTSEKFEKQRQSLIKHYKLNGGKSIRYKQINLMSPKNELITITKVNEFCNINNLGKLGFYEFLRRNDYTNSFRGWKVISKVI